MEELPERQPSEGQESAEGRTPTEYLKLDETIREHADLLRELPQSIREATKKMDQMRQDGIPDRAAYERVKAGLDSLYSHFSEVSQRVIDFHEEIEDSYRLAREYDARWREQPEKLRDVDPTAESFRKYDRGVMEILQSVVTIRDLLKHKGGEASLNDEAREKFRDALMAAYAELDALDQEVGEEITSQSQDREELVKIIAELNKQLTGGTQSPAGPVTGSLSSIRAMHREVKAQYVAVAHTLSEDQRRSMRGHIARLTGLVRQAENDEHRKLFAPKPVEPPLPPEPSANVVDHAALQAAVRLAIARAQVAAPSIARDVAPVLASVRNRGLLNVLGSAFKLK